MNNAGMSDIRNPGSNLYNTFGESYRYIPETNTFSSINTGATVGLPPSASAPGAIPQAPNWDDFYTPPLMANGQPDPMDPTDPQSSIWVDTMDPNDPNSSAYVPPAANPDPTADPNPDYSGMGN